MGRTDDQILFHGVSFFPSQIKEILDEVEGTSPHYQIILDREGGVDSLEIKVEVSDKIPSLDELKVLGGLRAQIIRRIKAVLDVDVKVTFIEPKSLRHITDGPGRVADRRPG
jgi:phenylacetate-CoA ligase